MPAPRLLLHICCAPDATEVSARLAPRFQVSGFFYNPCVEPAAEYQRRRAAVEQLAAATGLALEPAPYDNRNWRRRVRRWAEEPEGGQRCAACFRIRLAATARAARRRGYDAIATTLTISPHKNVALINRLGAEAARCAGVAFVAEDFTADRGFARSVERSRTLGLFRQDYCGCSFARDRSYAARLAALARHVETCRRCARPAGSRPIFSPVAGARTMLIGQAPGAHEGERGLPFAGPAGRRLFDWLARTGWTEVAFRRRVHMTAIAKCFPGPGVRGDARPGPTMQVNCAPFLERELHLVQPRVIIPVGRLAIERFLGARPLRDVVGRQFRVVVDGRPRLVIPLPHPSGASAWIFARPNRRRLDRALGLVRAATRPA